MPNPRVLPSDDTSPFLYGYPQGMQTQVQSTERQRLQQIKVMQLQQQQHQEMYQQSVNQTQQLYQVQHNIQFTPTSTMVGMPPGIKERSKSDQAAKVNSEKNRRITPEPVNANSEKSSKEKINKRGKVIKLDQSKTDNPLTAEALAKRINFGPTSVTTSITTQNAMPTTTVMTTTVMTTTAVGSSIMTSGVGTLSTSAALMTTTTTTTVISDESNLNQCGAEGNRKWPSNSQLNEDQKCRNTEQDLAGSGVETLNEGEMIKRMFHEIMGIPSTVNCVNDKMEQIQKENNAW